MGKRQTLPVLSLTPECTLSIAMGILLIPLRWVLAWCIAVALHETGHYLALTALKVKVNSILFSLSGVKMQTEDMSNKKEIIAALAGPIASLLPLLTASAFPRLAICGLFLSMYNFLPIYPMDGGRVVKACLLEGLQTNKANKIYKFSETVCIVLLVSLCVYFGIRISAELYASVIGLVLLIRSGKLKIPCKHALKRVQ